MSLWRWCCFVTRLYRIIYFENKLIERNWKYWHHSVRWEENESSDGPHFESH